MDQRDVRTLGREGVQTEAVMASVSREQFKIRSELEVVHIPTGAVFSAYPYSNPDDMWKASGSIGPGQRDGRKQRRLRRASPTHGIAVAA